MSPLETDDRRGVSRERNGIACVALVPMVMGNVLSLFGSVSESPAMLSAGLGIFAMYMVAPRRK